MLFKKSLFIFRRDLRLNDNTGLLAALEQSETVIPCFIFDPRQVGTKNEYRSSNALQFMVESLEDLETQLEKHKGKLYYFYGEPQKIVSELIELESIDAVFFNKDYTPFSIKRDEEINAACTKKKRACLSYHDALLNKPDSIKTGAGTPYGVFTAFCNKSRLTPVQDPQKNRHTHFYTKKIASSESKAILKKIVPTKNKALAVAGGSSSGHNILSHISNLKNYLATRDLPALKTSHLSAHLKFGTISVREAYAKIAEKLGNNHPLLRQLYWRDFFTYVAYHKPSVFGHAYHEKYDKVWWSNSAKNFEAWCKGKTGFPIVDAGMRELNTTGFMHNRVRMIVASFLTKDLHIDWRKGEKYFATQLVDYDPAVNNGNWQWSASTGCDAQPYFRIFNPWTQQEKFDPECEYIKRWVPELKNVSKKMIHTLFAQTLFPVDGYPTPICDHAKESKLAKEIYKKAIQ